MEEQLGSELSGETQSSTGKKNPSDYFRLLSLPAGVLLLLVVLTDITSRTFFKGGLVWGLSLENLMVVVIGFSSVAITYRRGMLVGTDFLVRRFGRRIRLVMDIIALLLGLGCSVAIVWLTATGAINTFGDGSRPSALRMPLWPWKMVLPLGVALLALEIIIKFISIIRELSHSEVTR